MVTRGLSLQRARQLANAAARVSFAGFDRDVETWPHELTLEDVLTKEERQAAKALLNCLDTIEPYLTPFPRTVNGLIAAVESSALTAEQKTQAEDAIRAADGYHLISANLAGPLAYDSLESMREGLQRKMNTKER
jgi:hypothetical protein